MTEAGIEPWVGSGGESYDEVLAESVINLYRTEFIRPRGPWGHNLDQVEYANLELRLLPQLIGGSSKQSGTYQHG